MWPTPRRPDSRLPRIHAPSTTLCRGYSPPTVACSITPVRKPLRCIIPAASAASASVIPITPSCSLSQKTKRLTFLASITSRPTLPPTKPMWAPMPLASISTGRAASGAACLTTMSSAILPRSTAAWLVLTAHWLYSVNTWRLS